MANIKQSIPQREYKQTIKFAQDDGTLVGDDPNQRKFEEIEKSFKSA